MRLVFAFLLRWITASFGLWLAVQLFGTGEGTPSIAAESSVFLLAGLVLSAVNVFIKPFITLISLPFTVMTLGLFTLIVNGLMVYLALWLTPGIMITFWSAVLAGIVIGIANFGISQTIGALKAVK